MNVLKFKVSSVSCGNEKYYVLRNACITTRRGASKKISYGLDSS